MGEPLVLPAIVPAAVADGKAALTDPHHRLAHLVAACSGGDGPAISLCVDAWIYDESLELILLVRHPRRGWVMPGGRVDVGEAPRQACEREVFEETGLRVDFTFAVVAAITEGGGELPHLGLSYVAVADPNQPLRPEPQQPARWWSLAAEWDSIYPHDRPRLLVQQDRMKRERRQGRYSARS